MEHRAESPSGATFVYAVCRPGSERALKADVLREGGPFRFAFSRPGLVTFKVTNGGPHDRVDSPFARVSGRSLGSFETVSDLAAALPVAPVVLHVFEREPGDPPDIAPPIVGTIERELRAALAERSITETPLEVGATVLDVLVAEGEPLFAGTRVHGEEDWTFPGGLPRIAVPADAPSRAFAKIEEAIAWARPALRKNELVLELGSAPGGSSDALVRRGLQVVGIDPGEMDPAFLVRAGNCFAHVRCAMGGVPRGQMPRGVAWLFLDVNLAPQVALRGLSRYVAEYRGTSLRGAFLTLKMNDAATVAAIPTLLDRLRAMGFARARAVQLPSNRSEICVFAET